MEEPLTAKRIQTQKDQQIVISSFFSLTNDNKDNAKPMMEQLTDSQVTIAITDPNSESNTASEVVIVQSDGQKMSTENQILAVSEEVSDVAETVIIQGNDIITTPTVNAIKNELHVPVSHPEPVNNIIDICVDSKTHENLIALKKAVGNQLSSAVISLEQSVSVPTVSMESSSTTMVTRSMSGTISRDVYNCDECDYSSHNKHYLKQHVDLVHSDERPYKCPFCEYAGKRSHSLREHLIVHSNERPFECTHCNATFRKKGHLTNHIKLHQKTVNCPLCQKSISHSDVEAHIKEAHNSEKLYVCEICSHVASDQDGIMKHLQKHKNQQIYICSSCNFMTPDFNTFLKHAESHAEADRLKEVGQQQKSKPAELPKPPPVSQNPQNAKVMVVCSECRFVAPNAEVMKAHMWKHIDQTKVEVPVSQSVADKKSSTVTSSATLVPINSVASAGTNVVTGSVKSSQGFPMTTSVAMTTATATTTTVIDTKNLASEKSTYKCVECDFVCTEAYGFVVHMLSHRPELQHQTNPAKSTVSTVMKSGQENSSVSAAVIKSGQVNSSVASAVIKTGQENSSVRKPILPQQTNQSFDSKKLNEVATTPPKNKVPTSGSSNSPQKKSIPNNPPFYHDSATARFHCTICGYSCEYQRTIKAHIWKHSGNENIDYPMFQNGPLSIYDDTPISKEEVTTQSNSNMAPNKTVLVEVIPKPRPSLKSPVFEKYKNAKHEPHSAKGKPGSGNISTVSTVAPALAHLLAARAIAGMKQKSEVFPNDADEQKPIKGSPSPKKKDSVKDSVDISGIKVLKMTNSESETTKETKSPGMGELSENENKTKMTVTLASVLSKAAVTLDDKLETFAVKSEENVKTSSEATLGGSEVVSNSKLKLLNTKESSEDTKQRDGRSVMIKTLKVQESAPYMEKQTANLTTGNTIEMEESVNSKESSRTAVMAEDSNIAEIVLRSKSRKRRISSPVDDSGDIHMVAKRFCTVEMENNQNSVVVETVDSISTDNGFTGMTSQQNSPRTIEVSQTETDCGDSGVASDTNTVISSTLGQVTTGQSTLSLKKPSTSSTSEISESSADEMMECDIQEATIDKVKYQKMVAEKPRHRTKSMAESAVTLLSLLKKGPNINPACPGNTNEKADDKLTETSKDLQQSDGVESSPQPKTGGISSSLLAVIEQLRERSQSETEVGENSSKKAVKKKVRRESIENVIPIEDVDNVEEFVEGSETKYRCKLCHYSNPNTYVIKQHMKLHKTKQPFECSLCDFMAESSESLQDHMIKHCKVRTYQCKLCSSAFNYKSQLRAHMRAHNEDVFVCDYCDFESTNPITFRNHVRAHNEKKQYKCEVCEKRFLTKYDLRSHKRGSCSKQRSFFCDECDFVAIGPQEQKSHAKIHHKEFKCGKCDYVTTSITRFQNHMKSHEEPKVLKCELCDFPAVSNRSLKSHMKRHINDQRFVQQPLEQYKCNLCGYVCHHLPSLKSHMWRHASDQNYSYEFTNEVINAAIDYDGRLDADDCKKSDIAEFNQTIGEKMKERLEGQGNVDMSCAQYAVCWVTFRCCQCGFETINKAELNLHMKSHSDVIRWTLQVSQNNSSPTQSTSKRRSEILKETAAIG